MQVRTIAKILDVLIIMPFIFAISGKHHIQPNYLLMAGILAFIAIAFRWYKNLEFDDRFLLAAQVSIFTVIASLYAPSSLSIEEFVERVSLPVEQIYALLFYAILIIIGIYTTFLTQTGFIGCVGNPQEVKKDSLIGACMYNCRSVGYYFCATSFNFVDCFNNDFMAVCLIS